MMIGDKIKEQREKLGISQTELAEKIKVSKQTLYKYENNIVTNIPSDKIEELSKQLDVSPAYLMGWELNNKERAIQDAELSKLNGNLKEYALKLSNLSTEKQQLVMKLIDTLTE